ncbi:GntR family transcriptional regulator [Marinococcus halophilus]|uniref:GntR family transcriptional regulator n=1 Tax=Marinococcus halophilus TaxID=1371 RepID=UPI001FD23947|nr:GntR family transcriptional regulator [Marinococcus halophilus]
MVKNEGMKIKRTFMRDEAYSILREWIMIGKLEPGFKLRDQELSDMLGISRTPVREALLRLEDEGLVVTYANRWTLVASINLEEAEHIYPIVQSLENLAVEQGFNYFSAKTIEKLKMQNEDFKIKIKSGDKFAALQADNDFHHTIVELAANPELTKLLTNLKTKVQRMEIHYFSEVDNSLESYDEHEKVIEALKSNDKTSIKKTVSANWENSLQRIRQTQGSE